MDVWCVALPESALYLYLEGQSAAVEYHKHYAHCRRQRFFFDILLVFQYFLRF